MIGNLFVSIQDHGMVVYIRTQEISLDVNVDAHESVLYVEYTTTTLERMLDYLRTWSETMIAREILDGIMVNFNVIPLTAIPGNRAIKIEHKDTFTCARLA
jgi:hypothetical protein